MKQSSLYDLFWACLDSSTLEEFKSIYNNALTEDKILFFKRIISYTVFKNQYYYKQKLFEQKMIIIKEDYHDYLGSIASITN